MLAVVAFVLPAEAGIDLLKTIPCAQHSCGVFLMFSLLFLAAGILRLTGKLRGFASFLTNAGFITIGTAVAGLGAIVASYFFDVVPYRWPILGLLFIVGLFFLATGILRVAKGMGYTKVAAAKTIAITAIIVILIIVPPLLAIPQTRSEGLRLDGSPYFVYPEVRPAGEPIAVEVKGQPFSVVAGPDATLEWLDDYTLRLTTRNSSRLAIRLEPEEAIYGLTERVVDSAWRGEVWPSEVGGLNLRGEIVHMWVSPTFEVYSPFYLSSRGYGMMVEGTWPGVYDIGKTRADELRVDWEAGPEEGFAAVFFYGPSLTAVLDRYTAYSGRPLLPPKWVFDNFCWRDENTKGEYAELDGVAMNAEVVEDITMYEKLGIPAGALIIDRPWAEGTFGYGNFNWDMERFPNPDRMLESLHKRGWKVIVWGAPWALGEFGEEAEALGYLVPGSDRCLDYTNPEAVAWHQNKIETFMQRWGVDGWKLDRGAEFSPSHRDNRWFDGRSGFEVHNDYPSLVNKTYYDASRRMRGDDFVLFSRFSYGGDKQWAVFWGGDATGSMGMGAGPGTDLGLRNSIISLLRTATMGYPVWGSDTGGYYAFKDRRVFARWLEFSAMNPLMEMAQAPWRMPTVPASDEEMSAIYRKYVLLHHSLIDYMYDLAVEAHETGHPIAYPLVFDYPDDLRVRDMWDEYMFGPKYLVAPVWRAGQYEREVYLPEGRWADYWDSTRIWEGPVTITYEAPLDVLPLFVKMEK
jgi:alpha-glucosidase (family GH31 glycosyl hydrolase)